MAGRLPRIKSDVGLEVGPLQCTAVTNTRLCSRCAAGGWGLHGAEHGWWHGCVAPWAGLVQVGGMAVPVGGRLCVGFLNIVVWIGKSTLWLVAYCLIVHALRGRAANGHGHMANHNKVSSLPLLRRAFCRGILALIHYSSYMLLGMGYCPTAQPFFAKRQMPVKCSCTPAVVGVSVIGLRVRGSAFARPGISSGTLAVCVVQSGRAAMHGSLRSAVSRGVAAVYRATHVAAGVQVWLHGCRVSGVWARCFSFR